MEHSLYMIGDVTIRMIALMHQMKLIAQLCAIILHSINAFQNANFHHVNAQ